MSCRILNLVRSAIFCAAFLSSVVAAEQPSVLTHEAVVSTSAAVGTVMADLRAISTEAATELSNFRIVSGNDQALFALDENSGQLTVHDPSKLQNQRRSTIRLKITADATTNSTSVDPYLAEFAAGVVEAGGHSADLEELTDAQQTFEITIRLTRPVTLPESWTDSLHAAAKPATQENTPVQSAQADNGVKAPHTPELSAETMSEPGPAPAAATEPVATSPSAVETAVTPQVELVTTSQIPVEPSKAPETIAVTTQAATPKVDTQIVPKIAPPETSVQTREATPAHDTESPPANLVPEFAADTIEPSNSDDVATQVPLSLSNQFVRLTLWSVALALTIAVWFGVRIMQRRRAAMLIEQTQQQTREENAEQRIAASFDKQREARSLTEIIKSNGLEELIRTEIEDHPSEPAASAACDNDAGTDEDVDPDPESLIPDDMLDSIGHLTPVAETLVVAGGQTRLDVAAETLNGPLHHGNEVHSAIDGQPDGVDDDRDLAFDCDAILDSLHLTDGPSRSCRSTDELQTAWSDDNPRSSLMSARREIERRIESDFLTSSSRNDRVDESSDHPLCFSSDHVCATLTLERPALSVAGRAAWNLDDEAIGPACDDRQEVQLDVCERSSTDDRSAADQPSLAQRLLDETSVAQTADVPLTLHLEARQSDRVLLDAPAPPQTSSDLDVTGQEATAEQPHENVMSDYLTSLLNKTREDKATRDDRRSGTSDHHSTPESRTSGVNDRRTPTTSSSFSGQERRGTTSSSTDRKPVKSYIEEYLAREAEESAAKSGTVLPSVSDAIGQPSAVVTAERPERAPVDVDSLRKNMESFRAVAIESVDQAIRSHRVRQSYGSLAGRKIMLFAMIAMLLLFVLSNKLGVIRFGQLNWIMVALIVLAFSELCLRLQAIQKQKQIDRTLRTVSAEADAAQQLEDGPDVLPFEPRTDRG